MFGLVWTVIIIAIICALASSAGKKKRKYPYSDRTPIVEQTHRPHEPVGEYSSNHADRVNENLIHHPEPEPGYVVLNGIKRRIEDCRNL
jgi:hypothetical protein